MHARHSNARREVLLEALDHHRQAGDLHDVCSELAELASGALANGQSAVARGYSEEGTAAAEELTSVVTGPVPKSDWLTMVVEPELVGSEGRAQSLADAAGEVRDGVN